MMDNYAETCSVIYNKEKGEYQPKLHADCKNETPSEINRAQQDIEV
jgi:hypothetical protein